MFLTAAKKQKKQNPNKTAKYNRYSRAKGERSNYFGTSFVLSIFERSSGRPSGRTNRVGRGLSLNRSQCGGCSTKYDTPSLKSSGLRAIPRLTLHGGFEIRRRRQNPACRGCRIGWPVRGRRRVRSDSSRSSGRARRRRAPPTRTTTTAAAPSDDDARYGRLQRNEKRRLS